MDADDLVELRRDLHRHPELGWREFRTTAVVAAELEELGFDLQFGADALDPDARHGTPDDDEVAAAVERARDHGAPDYLDRMSETTGLVAERTYGDGTGPTVGLRVDIDALPIQEATDDDHYPAREGFASRHPGVMHACGHDGHATIGVGVADALREGFDGTLKLFVQPAEEGVRGGDAMSRTDHVADVSSLLAIHLGLGTPTGTIVTGMEGFLATTKLDATYTGETAHAGADPHRGRNALAAATTATNNLLALPRHGDGPTRVNVGTLRAEASRNAIPDAATMELEVRGKTTGINEFAEERARQVLAGAAQIHDVDLEVETAGRAVTAESDDDLAARVADLVREEGGYATVREHGEIGGSDDAVFLMRAVQEAGGRAIYVNVGADLADGHHTPQFDFDEDALARGTAALAHAIRNL